MSHEGNTELMHLTQVQETKQNTFHWSIFNSLFDLAYRNAFVLITHWAPWYKHDSSSLLYSRRIDRIAEYSQAKASKTDTYFHHSPKY